MNTMMYAILLSLITAASADDRIVIKNNCNVGFEVSRIYFPTGTGIECHKMQKIASGGKFVIDNFFPGDDVMLFRPPVAYNSNNFTYINTLKNVMRNDDIGGECFNLAESGNVGVYSVEPEVSYLSLCEDEHDLRTRDIRISNTCTEPLELSFMQYIGYSGVYCSRLQTLNTGGIIDVTIQPSLDLLVLRSPGAVTSRDIKYVNSLENAISGTTDFFCHKIAKTGGGVYTIKSGIKLLELCGPSRSSLKSKP